MIISLTGYAGSGKSVASKYLQEKYGYKPHNFKDALIKELKENFPDLLKEIQETANENPSSRYPFFETIDQLFEEKPPLIRALMKNYGTEVRRKINKHYWVHKWMANLYGTLTKETRIVVDDCRFLNDVKGIRHFDGIVIRIIKTGQVNNDTHQTESEIDLITPDFVIQADDGDKQKIYDELDKIIDSLSK